MLIVPHLVPRSPHPVKPLSAVQEGSSEKKQQHRASLSSALSNGLERLKMVTTSSVQPVAPAAHPDKSDPKVKAGACPEVRLCQSCSRCAGDRDRVLPWAVCGSRPPFSHGARLCTSSPHCSPITCFGLGVVLCRV